MSIMRTTCDKASALNFAFVFSTGMLLALVAAAPAARGSDLPSPSPKVVSVTEATHDGISKINLLSDGSHLYLTEWPAAQVIAKLSLEGANRSVVASPFSNVPAATLPGRWMASRLFSAKGQFSLSRVQRGSK